MTNGLSATDGQQVAVGNQGALVCDGASCTIWPTPFTAALSGVSAYAKDRAYLVGPDGNIFY